MLLKDCCPSSKAEWHNFFSQNARLFCVFIDEIKVAEGRRFVLEEKEQSNTCRAMKKPRRFTQASTHAKPHAQSLLNNRQIEHVELPMDKSSSLRNNPLLTLTSLHQRN